MTNNILLIDNNDSFTYNIVELIRSINGNKVTVSPSSGIEIDEISRYQKIILSPGPGLPDDFPMLKEVLHKYNSKKPILGICLGHQVICQYYGSSLINMDKVIHGQPKTITHNSKSKLFKNIPKNFKVGLYHSWVVDNNNFPNELTISSISEEGYIMSVEHNSFPIFGVQFHPESFITQYGKQLMLNFLNL